MTASALAASPEAGSVSEAAADRAANASSPAVWTAARSAAGRSSTTLRSTTCLPSSDATIPRISSLRGADDRAGAAASPAPAAAAASAPPASSVSALPKDEQTAMGTWQPPSRPRSMARSALHTAAVLGSSTAARIMAITSASAARASTARAPWPTPQAKDPGPLEGAMVAGCARSGPSSCPTLADHPRRWTPAAASTMASKRGASPSAPSNASGSSSFRMRVCRLPRTVSQRSSGQPRRMNAWRRSDEVPTRDPAGRSDRDETPAAMCFLEKTTTSRGSSRALMAAMARPGGSCVGTSLRECTATSQAPHSSHVSSSLVNSPGDAAASSASGLSSFRSPSVALVRMSISMPGNRFSSRALTCIVWTMASSDLREPSTILARGAAISLGRRGLGAAFV
mmetsp:Transcript_20384/g.78317  ORF Transcript_20384/g.78317 Transcript_20384/m.78317 type:complete len:398 (-) Transcript_20384:23-1216(-)